MIPVLYEDKSIIICLKPPGILSQTGPGGNLPEILRQERGNPVYPVHRLDREAGGVMVYAKNRQAAGVLSDAIRRGGMQKEYLCIVRGVPAAPEGTYHDLLLHDRTRNKSFVVKRKRGGVREVSLSYWLLATEDDLSLVRVQLHTGRTHQIRVQFSSRGTPLLGDGKYGGGVGKMALWSCSLAFQHPKTGKNLIFRQAPEGEPWEKFQNYIKNI